MRTRTIVLAVLLAVQVAACKRESATTTASAPQAVAPTAPIPVGNSWIDKDLVGWNKAGAEIPKAPLMGVDDQTKERCQHQSRPATAPEDKLVQAAGWTLFGPLQMFGKSTMISGMATVDGNCRPRFMQTFVFIDGKFVGTLAPEPMDSRTDGAQRFAFIPGDDYVVAEFARYSPTDPLCCPSHFATVTYSIKVIEGDKPPVLVPTQVYTQEAPKQPEAK